MSKKRRNKKFFGKRGLPPNPRVFGNVNGLASMFGPLGMLAALMTKGLEQGAPEDHDGAREEDSVDAKSKDAKIETRTFVRVENEGKEHHGRVFLVEEASGTDVYLRTGSGRYITPFARVRVADDVRVGDKVGIGSWKPGGQAAEHVGKVSEVENVRPDGMVAIHGHAWIHHEKLRHEGHDAVVTVRSSIEAEKSRGATGEPFCHESRNTFQKTVGLGALVRVNAGCAFQELVGKVFKVAGHEDPWSVTVGGKLLFRYLVEEPGPLRVGDRVRCNLLAVTSGVDPHPDRPHPDHDKIREVASVDDGSFVKLLGSYAAWWYPGNLILIASDEPLSVMAGRPKTDYVPYDALVKERDEWREQAGVYERERNEWRAKHAGAEKATQVHFNAREQANKDRDAAVADRETDRISFERTRDSLCAELSRLKRQLNDTSAEVVRFQFSTLIAEKSRLIAEKSRDEWMSEAKRLTEDNVKLKLERIEAARPGLGRRVLATALLLPLFLVRLPSFAWWLAVGSRQLLEETICAWRKPVRSGGSVAISNRADGGPWGCGNLTFAANAGGVATITGGAGGATGWTPPTPRSRARRVLVALGKAAFVVAALSWGAFVIRRAWVERPGVQVSPVTSTTRRWL